MSQQPDISIITINYNGLEETCQLIESLQQYPQDCSYELIVVDNGSIQNEALLLQKKYPEVHVIRSEQNIGFSGGNNLGIQTAKGKGIFLLNNDTLVTANDLKYLYERLYSSPVIGAVSPKIKFAFPPQHIQFAGFTPLSKYTLRNRTIGYNETDEGQFDIPQETSYLHGAAMMVKREVVEQVGRMPEIYFLYYEEMDWPAAGLEHDPCAAGGVLRRPYAELTGCTQGCQVRDERRLTFPPLTSHRNAVIL